MTSDLTAERPQSTAGLGGMGRRGGLDVRHDFRRAEDVDERVRAVRRVHLGAGERALAHAPQVHDPLAANKRAALRAALLPAAEVLPKHTLDVLVARGAAPADPDARTPLRQQAGERAVDGPSD